MSFQSVISTMRVGFMDSNYPVPAGVSEEQKLEWIHRHAVETGCDCLQVRYPYDRHGPETVAQYRGLMEKYGMVYDIHLMLPFSRIGQPGGEDIAEELRRRCRIVKELGMDMLRTGYGGLKIESSRFLKPREAAAEQKRNYVASLVACAQILENEGVYLAVENHIDFKGSEQAEMLDEVDSPFVGCAMDTANGVPVYSDPDDDIAALAPYTFTTHMKDYEIVQEILPGRIPFMASSCAVGEGIIDFPRAVHLFAKYSPFRKGLHLIVESSTSTPKLGDISAAEREAAARQRIDDSVAYLLRLRAGK
jgi:sugar phosphate isomerase/epimerase